MLAVVSPFLVIWVIVGYAREPNTDCVHADAAARHWATVVADVHAGLGGRTENPTLSRDAADAASAIRHEADQVIDPTLRDKVLALATALERISRGNPSSAPNGWPDTNFMGGTQEATAALGELARACPTLGD